VKGEAALVFPHQLFRDHPALRRGRPVFLLEHPLFFHDQAAGLNFHKHKLILHRASMTYYQAGLERKGYLVHYIEQGSLQKPLDLLAALRAQDITHLYLCDVVDSRLQRWLGKAIKGSPIKLHTLPSRAFILTREDLDKFLPSSKRYQMTTFYRALRRRTGILMEDGRPVGGKLSYDPENRKKLPRDMAVPPAPSAYSNKYIKEAVKYVEEYFPSHPGKSSGFIYPVTRRKARAWLYAFLADRLLYFGDYQDAMRQEEAFLFHSLLSPSINTGLLTPGEVLEETLVWAQEHEVHLNSLEGFIRQILGWREFMRGIYVREGEGERNSNFWGHEHRLPDSFYRGTTGILPLDKVIARLLEYAYAHHIERLMVLGSFMLLCEIDPRQVYRWFMELFIDSYDWVMVPNVYGMSQYADGGLITTKPYINSSNYLRKMGDFDKGPWMEIWDGLYWRFVHRHREFFQANPRSRVLTAHLDRMGREALKAHVRRAERFLEGIF
jgi:deoxyribodipyrimidine photolyase-related protein